MLLLACCCWRAAAGMMLLACALLMARCWRAAAGTLLLARCCWRTAAGTLVLARCCWRAATGMILLACCCWRAIRSNNALLAITITLNCVHEFCGLTERGAMRHAFPVSNFTELRRYLQSTVSGRATPFSSFQECLICWKHEACGHDDADPVHEIQVKV